MIWADHLGSEKRLYSAEAALALGFHPSKMYQKRACAEIESVLIGHPWMFKLESLVTYVAPLQLTSPVPA